MSLGCECTEDKARKIYKSVTKRDRDDELNLTEFALIVSTFIDEECDPVDGIIEAISEKYDQKK